MNRPDEQSGLSLSRVARVAVVLSLLSAVAGCVHTIPRSPIADFFAKDFNLPPYRPTEAQMSRERHRVVPTATSAALGDVGGAWASGAKLQLDAAAGASVGDLGGAIAVATLARAAKEDPIPKDYSALELALPVIGSDPNSGVTFGLLPVSVFQEKERITNIFAPELTWNAIQGFGAKGRMLRFFSTDAQLQVTGGSTTNGAHEYEFIYQQRPIGPRDLLFFRTRVRYYTDLTTRFWGIGNDSKRRAQSSFVTRRADATVSLGFRLPFDIEVQAQEIVSNTSVGSGRLDDIPSTRAAFPDVPGVRERLTLLAHRVVVTFDTRDNRIVPTRGVFLEGYYEIGDTTLASDVSFQKFGFTGIGLYSYAEDRFATAVRIAGRLAKGSSIPFYEQTSLGGKGTLRGFGDGRFVDKKGYVLSVEQRVNFPGALNSLVRAIASYEAPPTIAQVALFLDAGRVFDENDGFTLHGTHVDMGVAGRLIVPSSEIVASLDVGIGSEGPAVFVGLDYPF